MFDQVIPRLMNNECQCLIKVVHLQTTTAPPSTTDDVTEIVIVSEIESQFSEKYCVTYLAGIPRNMLFISSARS